MSKRASEEERGKLLETLQNANQIAAAEEARKQSHARLRELARRQGVKPISNIAELQGDFWPEEESVDEFLSWVRELRQGDKPRSIPE
ncbi:MAG TPA: hypothetical protein VJT09_01505 [Pyrinomonadaceae bacterium]|nr:hypothetical protein [Pyrinomonadaceae bacterium]